MIRHIVMHKLKPEASAEAVAAWKAAALKLCEESPAVLNYGFGENCGTGANNYHTAFIMDFKDMDVFRAYIASDIHMEYVRTHAAPVVDTLAAIQHPL